MAINITPSTSNQRKQLFIQRLLNTTSKVSKIAPLSILSGVADGVASISGKTEKDIILALGQLYPDSADGSRLDIVADNFGIAPRFSASGSSTYVRLTAEQGTLYQAGIHSFVGSDGIIFELEKDVTVGVQGFTYAKVRSIAVGSQSNIDANTLDTVIPLVVGHIAVTNEYQAQGGRDEEDDDLFRRRIKDGANILATGTLSKLEQVLMLINSNVLRVWYNGTDEIGRINIIVASQNGVDFSEQEFGQMYDRAERYFSITELKPQGKNNTSILFRNIEWQPIDISFRVELQQGANSDEVRRNIQVALSKYFDIRTWSNDIISRNNLISIIKGVNGIKFIPNEFFYPSVDLASDPNKLPRVRGFLMLDLRGQVIESINGVLSPIFYPQQADFRLQQTVLRTIV
jgi:uncharacterized phage protein gp47/JayE